MSLVEILAQASTEEELKNFFAKFFRIKLSTKNFIDLYTPQIIFEFKLDAPLKNVQIRATTVAQTLYYIRRLKFGRDSRVVSQNICVVTKFNAIFFQTKNFARFYDDKNFDWDLAPSSPCKKLVADLANFPPIKNCHVYDFADAEDAKNFAALINHTLDAQFSLFDERKEINEQNFYQIFQHWQKIFGAAVENGHKSSEYFLIDIAEGSSEIVKNGVLFHMSSDEYIKKFLNLNEYKHFWSVYDKVRDPRAVIAIRQRMDRMTEINLRRFTGEFFTPIVFAEKAVDYLNRTVGEWWKSGKFRLWDMAAGTGNLEFALPEDALKYCYISTLLDDDADYCKKIFPEATVFQYDYLNDDVNFFGHEQTLEGLGVKRKMPQKLVDDLKNPELRWIIFINPPYATANNYERDKTKISKDSVSMTEVRKLMTADNMGKASQELFSQFLYRISKEFSARATWLGMFSKIKYINANADQKFRDKIFTYEFERGFIFNSKNFHGCKAQFPVGFLVWNLAEKIPLESQEISLDVYNNAVEKIAEKIFHAIKRDDTLNKWIERPRRTKKFPPMTSGINIQRGKVHCDKVTENFLADLMCLGNDFVHQNYTSILSGVYSDGHDISITPENFEQAMIVHMVRRLPKATWLNDRDQFMQPTKKLPAEFVTDAVIWSLFAPSNQTVSLRNVEYDGKIYRMPNNFFPFTLDELRTWEISSPEIKLQLAMAKEDRFAASWLKGRELSTEARAVLSAGRELYKKFFAELAELNVQKYKIADWDAGWYQIRMSLGETLNLDALSAKLLPQIYELGFLRDEVKYF